MDQEPSFKQKCTAIKSWYDECVSTHPECAPLQAEYPERLVYVGIEGENPRLVNARDGTIPENAAYAALSHCWGDVQPLLLSKDSLKGLHEEIPLESLPKTFLEAIQVTRHLHIPYLWVDSLCIVQDDPEDWIREAARMKHVYSSSSIVISAQDARNCTEGCFIDDAQNISGPSSEESRVETLQVLPQGWKVPLRLRVYAQDVQNPHRPGVLTTRGWALQEELLAHRNVHCMRPELRWTCQQMQRTETGHGFPVRKSLHRIRSGSGSQHRRWLWCNWMSDYSSRHFTFPSDRLGALVGIIHHYGQKTGRQHLLACWRETLIDDLLWLRGKPPVDSVKTSNSIPSWSWLLRAAGVEFDLWSRTWASFTDGIEVEDHATMVEASIDWAGEPMLSNIVSSTLVLEGPVREMRLRVDERALGYSPPYIKVGDEEPVVGAAEDGGDLIPWRCAGAFDQEVMREDEVFTCLLMRSANKRWVDKEGKHLSKKETFLMLVREPSDGKSEVFRRVGLAMISGEDTSFDHAQRKRIHLV